MSKWSKLKTLNKMVAKDKDEEEEEEEPVRVTKFEKEKNCPTQFLFGVKVEKNRIGCWIWNRLIGSIIINKIVCILHRPCTRS